MTRRLGSLRLCRWRRAVSGGDVLLNGRGNRRGDADPKVSISGSPGRPAFLGDLVFSSAGKNESTSAEIPKSLTVAVFPLRPRHVPVGLLQLCSAAAVQRGSFEVIAWKHFLSCWSAELRENACGRRATNMACCGYHVDVCICRAVLEEASRGRGEI